MVGIQIPSSSSMVIRASTGRPLPASRTEGTRTKRA